MQDKAIYSPPLLLTQFLHFPHSQLVPSSLYSLQVHRPNIRNGYSKSPHVLAIQRRGSGAQVRSKGTIPVKCSKDDPDFAFNGANTDMASIIVTATWNLVRASRSLMTPATDPFHFDPPTGTRLPWYTRHGNITQMLLFDSVPSDSSLPINAAAPASLDPPLNPFAPSPLPSRPSRYFV